MIKTKELWAKHMHLDDVINLFLEHKKISRENIIDIKYLGENALIIYDDGYKETIL